MVRWIQDPAARQSIAAEILHALPQWFGLPDSTAQYVRTCGSLPFWAWLEEDGAPSGFIALQETSPCAAEILCMGVLPHLHRRGIGAALGRAARDRAIGQGYEFLQVKTVQRGRYPEYDRTNAFYEALGFRPLECLPELWDPHNPCQLYIMALPGAAAERDSHAAGA